MKSHEPTQPYEVPDAVAAGLHLVVMSGGPSAEREVSLRSGGAMSQVLRELGHQVSDVDPLDSDWTLPEGTDLVVLALHGVYGEDGTVQRRLEELGVPYTGCDEASSRLAFDKVRTKQRLQALGLSTPGWAVITGPTPPWPDGWQPPVVLKPVRQGSSVGLQFVDALDQWDTVSREVLQFGDEMLLEERIHGREITVGILEGRALPIVEIRPKQGGYDYRNKYTSGATDYLCPAPLEAKVAQHAQELALKAFHAVNGRDYARIDAMISQDNAVFLLEVNTLPGMTSTSLLPKAAAAAGIGFAELCQQMVVMAWRRAGSAGRSSRLDYEAETKPKES